MNFAIFSPGKLTSLGAMIACAIGLSGCFDLAQKVAIGRDGSGGYAVSVAAEGIVGEGLAKKHAHIEMGDMRLSTRVDTVNGRTVQTTGTAFHDLSDLRMSDESMSLHVKGQKLLGLAGTEVNFHRSFNINHALSHHEEDNDDEHFGKDILTSMFGDHTYTFSVRLPGTIDHIAPLSVDGHLVQPQIVDNGDGHTITWRMKLTDMMLSDELDFDVDFTAHGNFHDTQSVVTEHRHHHSDES